MLRYLLALLTIELSYKLASSSSIYSYHAVPAPSQEETGGRVASPAVTRPPNLRLQQAITLSAIYRMMFFTRFPSQRVYLRDCSSGLG